MTAIFVSSCCTPQNKTILGRFSPSFSLAIYIWLFSFLALPPCSTYCSYISCVFFIFHLFCITWSFFPVLVTDARLPGCLLPRGTLCSLGRRSSTPTISILVLHAFSNWNRMSTSATTFLTPSSIHSQLKLKNTIPTNHSWCPSFKMHIICAVLIQFFTIYWLTDKCFFRVEFTLLGTYVKPKNC